MNSLHKHTRGFGILFAIMLLLLFSILLRYMLQTFTMLGSANQVASFDLEATMISKTGVEWAKQQLFAKTLSCNDTPVSVTLPQNVFPEGFTLSVAVPCTEGAFAQGSSVHEEGTSVYNRYTIISVAAYGNFGEEHYVSKTLRESFVVLQ